MGRVIDLKGVRTVGELREFLEGIPDNTEVSVWTAPMDITLFMEDYFYDGVHELNIDVDIND